MSAGTDKNGYILLEAAVAMVLLSLGVFTIHSSLQQAIVTRGQAQDYTQARFLLEQLIAEVEMQPELVELERSGRFRPPNDRFRWDYYVRRVDVPLPPPPSQDGHTFRYPMPYVAHVRATVYWTRSGSEYSETFETLLTTNKLWQPPTTP